ncbi:MAG: hypothetical protein KKG99_17245 [Bacteroidetes bacterium]|nr:hypothetical protein [Bacteroidota bacterium]
MKNFIPYLFITLFVVACNSPKDFDSQTLNRLDFGQTTPSTKIELFAPGIVSTGLNEGTITFFPDGKECYWSVLFSGFETIVTSRLENGKWTKPEVASFSGKYYDGWPTIQVDGKRMFFHSARPVPDTTYGITAEFNIWYMDRVDNAWSDPRLVNTPVNGSENSTCPSVSLNGNIYVSKRFSDGSEKLCRSELRDGVYQKLEMLPDNVNVLKDNFHGYISPEESYLIRPCYGRSDNIGAGWNYYISFRNNNNTWSDLINMGKEVNSVYCAGAPSISFDGKYLFFQGIVATTIIPSLDRKYSLQELIDIDIKNPSKGSTDIYWIDALIIEELRLKEQN